MTLEFSLAASSIFCWLSAAELRDGRVSRVLAWLGTALMLALFVLLVLR